MLPTLDGGKALLVGIDDAPPAPIQIGSPEGGNFPGFEVDLLHELQKRLGLGLKYRRALWSVILTELAVGKLDVICSAATITSERSRAVDFCRPHLTTSLGVVRTLADPSGITINGARVGVRRGTTAEDRVRTDATAGSIMLSESNEELYSALSHSRIDAVIDDSPIARYFARIVPGLRFAGSVPESESGYAIALKKGNARLREILDAAITALEADGTLQQIRKRWLAEEGPYAT